jgi:hypothetical protein
MGLPVGAGAGHLLVGGESAPQRRLPGGDRQWSAHGRC